MYKHVLKKLPKSTTEIIVTLAKERVATEYEKAFNKLQKDLTVEGFRKGKAPKAVAVKSLKKEDVYRQLIQDILPSIYEEIVKKESLKPLISPRIELVKAKENEDWEIKLTVAEKPIIDLKDYKKAVERGKAEIKKNQIWTPGKGQAPSEKENQEKVKQDQLNSILGELLKTVEIELSELIIEVELNNRLTQAVDDIQKIGLTVDNYLKSKNLTMDDLRARYKREIVDTYKLEFLLQEIGDKENIKVETDELEKLFSNIKDEAEKEKARLNSYFYAGILRKQKVLDFLTSL